MSRTAKCFLPTIILWTFLPSGIANGLADSSPGVRSIVVNVFDTRGSAIRGLTKENFRVRLNGKPVAVLDARYSVAPRRIVVLLDMSSSMSNDVPAKWKIAREAVHDLLAQTPGDVPIAMLTFAGDIRDVFAFPDSRTAIARWLENGPGQRPKLKYPARTALFDAILEGLRLFGTVQPGDVIYVITDGGENASHASAVEAKAALLQSRVALFVFLFAEPGPPSERAQRDFFLSLVDDSGGLSCGVAGRQVPFKASFDVAYSYDKENREKVKLCTQGLSAQFSEFWTLDLAAAPSNRNDKVKLEVISREGKVRKDVGVTFPRFLLPPK